MGEQQNEVQNVPPASSVALDTFAGKIHVEWNPDAAVTPLGQMAFFIEFLKTSGVYEPWIADCPLHYTSPNAPKKRDVLGTVLLSVLSGHHRYSHMTTVRSDSVNPELLGMSKVVSEDAVRRGFKQMDESAGTAWLTEHLRRCSAAALSLPWILDGDTTVKPLYGHQEGAVVGYNPQKPGRPSHAYHSYVMANTRLVLEVEVHAGNRTATNYSAPALRQLLGRTPRRYWPTFFRGDSGWGTDGFMSTAESMGLPYLVKLRLTRNVRRLIERAFARGDWADAGQGWEGLEERLQLTGWSLPRRVIVLRRKLTGDVTLSLKRDDQLELGFVETPASAERYEYAVLATTLQEDVLTIAQHYRDRADTENIFDELKNQWGWGGYTTKDLKRCRLMARIVALVYNWWSLFARLARPDKHLEAITSRPLLLHAVATKTCHQRQTTVTIAEGHAKAENIRTALQRISAFLGMLKRTAEQLTQAERWIRILNRAFCKLLGGQTLHNPDLLPFGC